MSGSKNLSVLAVLMMLVCCLAVGIPSADAAVVVLAEADDTTGVLHLTYSSDEFDSETVYQLSIRANEPEDEVEHYPWYPLPMPTIMDLTIDDAAYSGVPVTGDLMIDRLSDGAHEVTVRLATSEFRFTLVTGQTVSDITYDLGGGSWATGYSAPTTYVEGQGVALPGIDKVVPYEKAGYQVAFAGWCLKGTTEIVDAILPTDSGDKELVASYDEDPIAMTVTFDGNGGSAPSPSSKQVTYGQAYGVLPTAYRSDYDFDGWFTSADGGSLVTAATLVSETGDHTLYAHWTYDPYVPPGPEPEPTPSKETETNPDGSTTERETKESIDPRTGETTTDVKETTTGADGSESVTVSTTVTDRDGNSKTTSTTESTDAEGTTSTTESESTTTRNSDGTTTTNGKSTTESSDGTTSETTSTSTTSRDGRTSSGSSTTVTNNPDQTVSTTSTEWESRVNSEGSTTRTESSSTSSTDGSSHTAESESTSKRNRDGSTTTSSTETITYSDGTVTTRTTESNVARNGTVRSETTETVTNPDGTSIQTDTSSTTRTTGNNKVTTSKTTTAESGGAVTVEDSTTTVASNGRTTRSASSTTTNPDGSQSSVSGTVVTTRSDEGTFISTDETRVNADGSTTVISKEEGRKDSVDSVKAKETTTLADGSRTSLEYDVTTQRNDDGSVSIDSSVIETAADGSTKETETESKITAHQDGSTTTESKEKVTGSDGSVRETQSTVSETEDGRLQSIESDSRYTNPDGSTTDVKAKGTADRIEVIVSDTKVQDIENAVDSVSDVEAKVIVIGTEDSQGTITLPSESVSMLAEGGYQVSVNGGKEYVALDNDVVSKLADEGGEVTLTVVRATSDNTPPVQMETIGDLYAVQVTLTVNGRTVHELNGKAEIQIEAGYKAVYVYYVDDSGNATLIEGSGYDERTGKVSFDVEHFSVYMVSAEPYEKPEKASDMTVVYIAIAISIVCLIILVAFLWRRSQKD